MVEAQSLEQLLCRSMPMIKQPAVKYTYIFIAPLAFEFDWTSSRVQLDDGFNFSLVAT